VFNLDGLGRNSKVQTTKHGYQFDNADKALVFRNFRARHKYQTEVVPLELQYNHEKGKLEAKLDKAEASGDDDALVAKIEKRLVALKKRHLI